MTDVEDQEHDGPCNSCTAYAVVAAIEGTYNKKNGLTGAARLQFDADRLFMEAAPAEKCNVSHWWPENALAHCKANGVTQKNSTTPHYKIADFESLIGNNLAITQKKIKDWITDASNPGPVVAVMVQFRDFYDYGANWTSSGQIQPTPYIPSRSRNNDVVGGHVVSIVGFDDNPPGNVDPYWLCKNSWGSDWNGTGYVRIAQSKNNKSSCYIDMIDLWGIKTPIMSA